MLSAYNRFRQILSNNQERTNNICNLFVEDTMEDIIKSLNYVVTKTRTSVSSHFSKSNGAGSKSGECRECNRPGPKHWCIPYETRRLQRKWKKWTSGNEELDEYIRQTQLAASSATDYLEWIPYEKLEGVKEAGKGGLGPVYQAEWTDGPKFQWKEKSRRWVRQGRTRVALKCLQNSGKATTEFLNELKEHHRCVIEDHVPQCYGITRQPDADGGDYMIVTQYANEGCLRDYLSNHTEVGWLEKLKILKDIADGLQMIHNRVLIHRNLHPGNLLRHIDEKTKQGYTLIADLGLSRPLVSRRISSVSAISGEPNKSKIYGVLPYVAPEVMRGEGYSKAADVYSFGVVMWELAYGQKPFPNRPHNFHLALDICNGLRPAIGNPAATAPKCYIDLVGKCWDAHPAQRPDVTELRTILERWLGELQENSPGEFGEFAKQEKESSSSPSVQPPSQNPQAIYISRQLNFADLPKPQNSSSYEPRNYEFIEFEESEVVDGDSRKLELFIPKTTTTVKSPLVPKIPEVKVDSINMDTTAISDVDDDEQSSY